MVDRVLLLETSRDGYAPSDCGATLTVGELIEILNRYDDDTKIYLSNDSGYTYGAVRRGSFRVGAFDDDDE